MRKHLLLKRKHNLLLQPGALVINPVAEGDKEISGSGKAKQSVVMTVQVAKDKFEFLGSTEIIDSGKWSFAIPEDKKQLIKKDYVLVTYQDLIIKKQRKKILGAGEKPVAPTSSCKAGCFSINPVAEGDKEITGTGKPKDYVVLTAKTGEGSYKFLGDANS